MPNKTMGALNSMTQFLSSFLEQEEANKEKKRKAQNVKKMEEQLNSGNFTIAFDSEGNIKLQQISPLEIMKTQQMMAVKKKVDAGQPLSPEENLSFEMAGINRISDRYKRIVRAVHAGDSPEPI